MDNQGNVSNAYIDEEKITALTLSVKFWSLVSTNPNTTPATERKVLETADRFYSWLTG